MVESGEGVGAERDRGTTHELGSEKLEEGSPAVVVVPFLEDKVGRKDAGHVQDVDAPILRALDQMLTHASMSPVRECACAYGVAWRWWRW
jgi:hypothetical protein